MDDFKNFLKENNYEGDLEFQLCDLELAFNEGKKLKWKPSDEQIESLSYMIESVESEWAYEETIGRELLKQLKKLRKE